ncbi:MAG: mannosyl-D-glycerate transport/metabolism system repressor mngR [Flavobacteriales bacterium]|nr:mannosyl-D-glycerate transport/metabolism system repressor mngR [Flavobacteriales bacterium]
MTGPAKGSGAVNERPQYVRISDLLRDRIASGAYGVGAMLPTEGELCREFRSSRHTVREALRLLTTADLISCRQGSGCRVMAAVPHQNYVHAMRSLDQLFQYASDTRFFIEKTEVAVPESGIFPDIGTDGAEWLIVRGLRLKRDEDIPICASTVLVNKTYADIAEDLATGAGAIYRRIEKRFGVEVAEVVQDITVTSMPARATLAMSLTQTEVAVQVRRRYLDKDKIVILASVNYHPADRFSYTMQLRREGAKRSRS